MRIFSNLIWRDTMTWIIIVLYCNSFILLVSYIGLPGLGMRVISEIFHALGKCSRRRMALKIDAMSAIPFMGSSLIALFPIRS